MLFATLMLLPMLYIVYMPFSFDTLLLRRCYCLFFMMLFRCFAAAADAALFVFTCYFAMPFADAATRRHRHALVFAAYRCLAPCLFSLLPCHFL